MVGKAEAPAIFHRKSTQSLIWKTISIIILLGGCTIVLLPLAFMVSTALKTDAQTFEYPIRWIPDPVIWSNFKEAWIGYAPFNLYLRNTVMVTSLAIIGTVLSSALVAFSFARLRWRGRDVFFLILLSTMMLPYQVTMIPQFVVFRYLYWVNTFKPLIIPHFFGSPFYIFLLRQFFLSLPTELDDAVRVDGGSTHDLFWKIMLPLCKPALATVTIFTFMAQWNDFLGPLIYLNDTRRYTLALGLMLFRTEFQVYWNSLMAVSFIVMLPCLLVFFFFQRYFIQGIVTTGLKG